MKAKPARQPDVLKRKKSGAGPKASPAFVRPANLRKNAN